MNTRKTAVNVVEGTLDTSKPDTLEEHSKVTVTLLFDTYFVKHACATLLLDTLARYSSERALLCHTHTHVGHSCATLSLNTHV